MRLIPVSLAIFFRKSNSEILEVWTQKRSDDGIYHGLQEFPGGGIEENESPLEAIVREVEEEVGITVLPALAEFMGTYSIFVPGKTILLNVFLFPDHPELVGKGKWLKIEKEQLSSPYRGEIPAPNHQIIDDLYRSIYS